MMSLTSLTPVAERITREICDTLEGVTTAAGYFLTLAVERPNPTAGNRVGDAKAVVVPGTPTPDETQPIGHTAWVRPYSIVVTVQDREDSDEAIDTKLEFALADVTRALAEDHTRGGLAWDTTFEEPELSPLAFNAHTAQVTVNINVRYRTRLNNPFSSSFEDED
jgi:hypothetical protein